MSKTRFPNAVSASGSFELMPLMGELPSNRPALVHAHILAVVGNAMLMDISGKCWQEMDDRLNLIISLLYAAVRDTLPDGSSHDGDARRACALHATQILRAWPTESREIVIEKDGTRQYTRDIPCPRTRQALFEWIVDAWVWDPDAQNVAQHEGLLLMFASGPHMAAVLAALRKRDEHASTRRVEALILDAEAQRSWRDERWVQNIIETARARWVRSMQLSELLFLVRLSHESGGTLSQTGKEFLAETAGKVRRLEQATRSFQEHVGQFLYRFSIESVCSAAMTVTMAYTVSERSYHATFDEHVSAVCKEIEKKIVEWTSPDPSITLLIKIYEKNGSDEVLRYTIGADKTTHKVRQ